MGWLQNWTPLYTAIKKILRGFAAKVGNIHLTSVTLPMGHLRPNSQIYEKYPESQKSRSGDGWISYAFSAGCNVMLLPPGEKVVSFLLFNNLDNANLLYHLSISLSTLKLTVNQALSKRGRG